MSQLTDDIMLTKKTAPPPFSCSYSPQLAELLTQLNCTIVISSFQAGKLIFISPLNDDKIVQLPRTFNSPMGIAVEKDKLVLATKNEVITFKQSCELAKSYPAKPNVYDGIYLPTNTKHTGTIDLHDLVYCKNDLYGVSTSFSAVVKLNTDCNYEVVWTPKFISKLASEDRCHLNGIAKENNEIKYVTAFAQSDTPRGWKDYLPSGGLLIDYATKEIIAEGLEMPHSPRIYDGKLYVLLSATGELATIDVTNGKKEVIKKLGGFARGMCRYGDYLFIGLSKLRKNSSTFSEINFNFPSNDCAIKVIHLPTGALVGELKYESSVDEIYDINIIPDLIRPNILNTITNDYTKAIVTPDNSYWSL